MGTHTKRGFSGHAPLLALGHVFLLAALLSHVRLTAATTSFLLLAPRRHKQREYDKTPWSATASIIAHLRWAIRCVAEARGQANVRARLLDALRTANHAS